MKRVIVTGDDFGLAVPVNEAILEAHERGVLTTASLMVAGAASADAVRRARATPTLKVGLHLVLVEGLPTAPPAAVADLIDANGEFPAHLTRAGARFFFRPRVRKQLAVEIRAQFEAFAQTGLALDHVNAHNHMHLHPTVLTLMLKIGKEYGMRAIRLPYEPPLRAWRAARKLPAQRLLMSLFLAPWIYWMRRRCRRRDVRFNDCLFGMTDSGNMTADLLEALVRELPEGTTELYFHPATRRCPELDRTMREYRHREEFEALTSRSVASALRRAGVLTIPFSALQRNR